MQHKRALILPIKTKAEIILVIAESINCLIDNRVHRFHPFVCKILNCFGEVFPLVLY